MSDWIDQIRFDANGLVTAIAQDYLSHRVLMVAHMNREAIQKTIETGQAVYFSRSRQSLWHKGETSGHYQKVHELRLDCDGDVILMQVSQSGGIACHTGRESCFYFCFSDYAWKSVDPVLKAPSEIYDKTRSTTLTDTSSGQAQKEYELTHQPQGMDDVLSRLSRVIASRRHADPESSYVARLLQRPPDAVLKKIGEEATETVMACKDGQTDRIIAETADLWFHCMVMLAKYNLEPQDVLQELVRREGLSGLAEKAARNTEKDHG